MIVNRSKACNPDSKKHFVREELSKLDKDGDSVLIAIAGDMPYITVKNLVTKLKQTFFSDKNIHYVSVRNRSGNITHLKAFIGKAKLGPRLKRIKI